MWFFENIETVFAILVLAAMVAMIFFVRRRCRRWKIPRCEPEECSDCIVRGSCHLE